MRRRDFLRSGSAAAAGFALGAPAVAKERPASLPQAPTFSTSSHEWQSAYDHALAVLAGNVRVLPRFDAPVLIEGAEYPGVWQECAPQESLVYRQFRSDVARNTHLTFFALQKEDGQLPANNKLTETGFGQIQMVVPIAATAWELAEVTGDHELLEKAYSACSRWDTWLMRFRNIRGTGLIEGFCTYDTGHDNSPRWRGIPPQCPGKDARRCAAIPSLPRLCPDLSATVYGGRVALEAMARALGKTAEADHWAETAENLRQLIMDKLFVVEDAAFYDLDAQERFVNVRSDVLSRVCGEHVPDAKTFSTLWERQLHNPGAFWAPYPLPSIALDDPSFVRPVPRNSWGGPSQALTALRAGRWFDHYERSAEFGTMMDRWCEALIRDGTFRQQMDPQTGEFTQAAKPGYSPAALVLFDYTWRLAGVREEKEALQWNVRPGQPAASKARFHMPFGETHRAELSYHEHDVAHLSLDGRPLAEVIGGAVRLETDRTGKLKGAVGIAEASQSVRLRVPGCPVRSLELKPNQRVTLA